MRKFLFIFAVILTLSAVNIYGSTSYGGVLVDARIEAHTHTIAAGEVYAHNFIDAIEHLSTENNIITTFEFLPKQTNILSADGIENGSLGKQDKWLGYILRDGKVLMPDNFLAESLEEKDIVVLYYGTIDDTSIVTELTHEIIGKTADFNITVENSNWIEKDGKWILDDTPKAINNGKLHLILPNSNTKILKLTESGTVSADLLTPGIYKYFVEFYNEGTLPEAVKTGEKYFYFGAENSESITRGEFTAFLVNTFGLKPISGPEAADFNFQDVNTNHPYYYYLKTAHSQGIINGVSKDELKPDEPVSLLQASVMLSKFAGSKSTYNIEYDGPEWASLNVKPVIAAGFLDKFDDIDWNRPVTENDLIRIYRNLNR